MVYFDMLDWESIDWRAFDIGIVTNGKWTSVNFLLRFYYFPVVITRLAITSKFHYDSNQSTSYQLKNSLVIW